MELLDLIGHVALLFQMTGFLVYVPELNMKIMKTG